MGAFNKLFGKIKAKALLNTYFGMLDGYTPAWTTYDGGVYEMELTRACVNTFALHCSKLQPKVTGPDSRGINKIFAGKVNLFQTCSQFIYKAATLYETTNTVFIVPVLDHYDRITGFYPVAAETTELKDYNGVPYLVYTFGSGEKASIELDRVGVVNKFLYRSDLVGEDNSVLQPTMQLLDTQNKGITEGIKNSASFRFMATVSNFAKGKDLANERENWVRDNLGSESGGLALFPNTYTNVQQIQSAAKTVDPEQMAIIQNRVFTYFGTNEKILTNSATGDDWDAYYEGRLEPFALQLSEAMTAMTYSQTERARQNAIVWSANRLQYMTNADKLQTSSQLFDRGVLSTNDVMDIWNLPHVPGGDKRYIRKEYIEITQLEQADPEPVEPVPDPEPTEEGSTNGNTKTLD